MGFDFVIYTLKHLPGQHPQQSHAPTKGKGASAADKGVTGSGGASSQAITQKEEDFRLAQEVLANTDPETLALMEKYKEQIANGTPTSILHTDPETGEYTPERQALHDKIVNSFFDGRTPAEGQPQFVVTGGLPGAGKTTVLKTKGDDPRFRNAIEVNTDDIKAKLPEYQGWNAGLLHEESGMLAARVMRRATEGGYNVVYDTTMKQASNGIKIVEEFKTRGYKTHAMFTEIPLKSAMERAIYRTKTEGRYVPVEYIATHDMRNKSNFEVVKGVVDSWEHWDNGQPFGEPPTLIGEDRGVTKLKEFIEKVKKLKQSNEKEIVMFKNPTPMQRNLYAPDDVELEMILEALSKKSE